MKTRLRRFGIVTFAALSLLTWAGNANLFNGSEFANGTRSNAFLLGSSLGCLVALIISEVADWGRSLLETTRQEIFLAELPLADLADVQNPQDERILDEMIAWRAAMLEGVAVGPGREWIDVRHPVEVEGLG